MHIFYLWFISCESLSPQRSCNSPSTVAVWPLSAVYQPFYLRSHSAVGRERESEREQEHCSHLTRSATNSNNKHNNIEPNDDARKAPTHCPSSVAKKLSAFKSVQQLSVREYSYSYLLALVALVCVLTERQTLRKCEC